MNENINQTTIDKTEPQLTPEQQQVDSQNAQLAGTILQLLDQPACRPSMLTEEGRRNAQVYTLGLDLLMALAKGQVVVRPAEAINTTG